MKNLAVLVPSYDGKLLTGAVTSLFNLQAGLNRMGCGMGLLVQNNIALVEEARNLLLAAYIRNEFDAALLLDADIEFSMQDFGQLLLGIQTYDIVAGLYRAKTEGQRLYFMRPEIDNHRVEDFIPCKRVPAGFMLVRGHVLRQLWDSERQEYQHTSGPVRPVFECGMRGGEFVGEDYTFCDKAKALGFSIAAATKVSLLHYGQRAYQGSYSEDHSQCP